MWPFGVAEHDVGMMIAVQIGGRHGVGRALFIGDVKSRRELSLPVVQVHRHRSRGFISDSKIDGSIAVEIRGGTDPRRCIWRSERGRSCEPRFAVIEVDAALPAVAAW